MDNIDKNILVVLQSNGRLPNAELAKKIGLSPPSVLDRVRKLEESGIIEKYIALINPQAVGGETTAFVAVSLSRYEHQAIASFHQAILRMPEVLECYHITREDDQNPQHIQNQNLLRSAPHEKGDHAPEFNTLFKPVFPILDIKIA